MSSEINIMRFLPLLLLYPFLSACSNSSVENTPDSTEIIPDVTGAQNDAVAFSLDDFMFTGGNHVWRCIFMNNNIQMMSLVFEIDSSNSGSGTVDTGGKRIFNWEVLNNSEFYASGPELNFGLFDFEITETVNQNTYVENRSDDEFNAKSTAGDSVHCEFWIR